MSKKRRGSIVRAPATDERFKSPMGAGGFRSHLNAEATKDQLVLDRAFLCKERCRVKIAALVRTTWRYPEQSSRIEDGRLTVRSLPPRDGEIIALTIWGPFAPETDPTQMIPARDVWQGNCPDCGIHLPVRDRFELTGEPKGDMGGIVIPAEHLPDVLTIVCAAGHETPFHGDPLRQLAAAVLPTPTPPEGVRWRCKT